MKLEVNFMKKNYGFGIVEVICSLFIFSLVFLSVFKLQMHIKNLQIRDKKVDNYYVYLSGVKDSILKNCSYDDIKALNNKKKLVIPSKYINCDCLCKNQLVDLFKIQHTNYPYLVMKVQNFEKYNVLKIKLSLFFKLKNRKQDITTEFIKGNY